MKRFKLYHVIDGISHKDQAMQPNLNPFKHFLNLKVGMVRVSKQCSFPLLTLLLSLTFLASFGGNQSALASYSSLNGPLFGPDPSYPPDSNVPDRSDYPDNDESKPSFSAQKRIKPC